MTKANHKSRPGAPQGNQNTRKHGFYSKLLDEDEQYDLTQAVEAEGLDEEIALIRVKIKSVLRHDPQNLKLITRGTEVLARLLRERCKLSRQDKNGLKEALLNVFRDVALPLGIIKSAIDK